MFSHFVRRLEEKKKRGLCCRRDPMTFCQRLGPGSSLFWGTGKSKPRASSGKPKDDWRWFSFVLTVRCCNCLTICPTTTTTTVQPQIASLSPVHPVFLYSTSLFQASRSFSLSALLKVSESNHRMSLWVFSTQMKKKTALKSTVLTEGIDRSLLLINKSLIAVEKQHKFADFRGGFCLLLPVRTSLWLSAARARLGVSVGGS